MVCSHQLFELSAAERSGSGMLERKTDGRSRSPIRQPQTPYKHEGLFWQPMDTYYQEGPIPQQKSGTRGKGHLGKVRVIVLVSDPTMGASNDHYYYRRKDACLPEPVTRL